MVECETATARASQWRGGKERLPCSQYILFFVLFSSPALGNLR